MVAHAILSPYAVYVYLYRYMVWEHIPGDPPECSAEESYNSNNDIRTTLISMHRGNMSCSPSVSCTHSVAATYRMTLRVFS